MVRSFAHSSRGTTTDRLRADIDRGRTGDKVSWPDPAAAPLGTDEEAAGTPLHATVVEDVHAEEIRRPHGDPDSRHNGVGIAWWLGVFGAMVTALLGWAVLST